jgi:hypothetical protein
MNQKKNKSRGKTSSHQHRKAPSQLNRKKKKAIAILQVPLTIPIVVFWSFENAGKEKTPLLKMHVLGRQGGSHQ